MLIPWKAVSGWAPGINLATGFNPLGVRMKMNLGVIFQQGGDRKFKGIPGYLIDALAIVIALYHLYVFTSGSYEIFVHRSIHVGSILALCFLTTSPSKTPKKFLIGDVIFALISLSVMVYLISNANRLIYERLALFPGSLTTLEVIMGFALMLMLLEASRRAMGPLLGFLGIFFLFYAYFGPYFGGILRHSGYSFSQIVDFTVFSEQGIFSMPVGVSSTYIILFLIFAGLVRQSGATDFFRDLALSLAGNLRGGPAKVAVIGSAFIGSITGSAAANVVITGSVTIPMMKKAGYKPYFAGAVEAAASTGGHILPPIMAGTMFLMADFIGVTYWSLCAAALIPALLYFWGIFVQVHFYSVKKQIATVNIEEIPPILTTLKNGGQHFLPFIVLVGLLAKGYSPIYSALWSLPVVIGASWIRKETRIGIKKILQGLSFSIHVIRLLLLATSVSGMIMGVVMSTGMGTKLMVAVGSLSQGRLGVALLIAAAASFILGMALSGIASYILTVILIVPATVKMGVDPVAAHLFSFYFAHLSAITPPVGATFYQAAALAQSEPFKTGWTATRLVFAGFIIPIFFVYYPSMLLIGSAASTVLVVTIAVLSIAFIGVGLEGWLFKNLNIVQRALFIIGGILLIIIKPTVVIISFIMISVAAIWNWSQNRAAIPADP